MEKYVDITVTKSATFNTGNFGNVRPEVTITIKNVPVSEVENEYSKITEVVDAMFGLNAIDLLEDAMYKEAIGVRAFSEALKSSKDNMVQIIRNYARE